MRIHIISTPAMKYEDNTVKPLVAVRDRCILGDGISPRHSIKHVAYVLTLQVDECRNILAKFLRDSLSFYDACLALVLISFVLLK